MKISTQSCSALRLMVDVARHGSLATPVAVGQVAQRTGLSRATLEQLATALRRAGLLHGTAGRGGGYRLARGALQITVADVVEAVSGPLCLADCLERSDFCSEAGRCAWRPMYAAIEDEIRAALRECTLASLAGPLGISWDAPVSSH